MSIEQRGSLAGRQDRPAERPAVVEVVAGALFVVIAAVGGWSLLTNPYLELGQVGSDPGPGFVPWLGVWAIGLGGLAQIAWVLMRARAAGGLRGSGEFVPARLWLPVLLIVSMVLYHAALRALGFIPASLLFAVPWVAIIHWRTGERFTARHLVQLPLEASLIVAAIYVVFHYGIQIQFP